MSQLEDLLLEAEASLDEIRNYHSIGAAYRLECIAKELQGIFENFGS
jgi:hypothetical protein